MIKHPQVLDKYQKEINALNQNFAQYEKIKKFELLPKPWTIETGEFTPTLKLKRKVILSKNNDLIEKIYAE